MKKLRFTVEVEFEDKITQDSEIQEVANNVFQAVVSRVDNEGVVPEESETFTRVVRLHEPTTKLDLEHDFIKALRNNRKQNLYL